MIFASSIVTETVRSVAAMHNAPQIPKQANDAEMINVIILLVPPCLSNFLLPLTSQLTRVWIPFQARALVQLL